MHSDVPLVYQDLRALVSENYCLTCRVGAPNPLESICDDCARRPRFCASCAIAYVEGTGACLACAQRLHATLVEVSQHVAPTDFEAMAAPCPFQKQSAPVLSSITQEKEPRPKCVVYLSNAPFDDFRSGDGTYINQIVKWVTRLRTLVRDGLTYDVAAFRVCDVGPPKKIPREEADTPFLAIPYVDGWPTSKNDTEKMSMRDWQKHHELSRGIFFNELAKRRAFDAHPTSVHIFHAQVR
jgi:hypothetical protein